MAGHDLGRHRRGLATGSRLPACTLVGVDALAAPELLIAIEATAVAGITPGNDDAE